MAAIIRFPLKMGDGAQVKTIEELREHFDLAEVLRYYDDGSLCKWLRAWYYDDEAEHVEHLDPDSHDFKKSLCGILGAPYQAGEFSALDLGDIVKRNERIERLRLFTADERVLAAIDSVAFTQEELKDLLDRGIREIYLCGERFKIPGSKDGVVYIGMHDPEPIVEFSGGISAADIEFRDLRFDMAAYLNDKGTRFFEAFRENPRLGIKLLWKEAEEGSAIAQTVLGDCYMRGFGVKEDDAEAVKWFTKAAHLGETRAQSKLAHCYRYGKGTVKDVKKALMWSEKAAGNGDIDAQTRMGIFCEHGIGMERSLEEAARWYQKAAEQGGKMAKYYLGLCYKDGKGMARNKDEAARWLQEALAQGINEARNALMEIKPDMFELSETILYAIGGWSNLESCRLISGAEREKSSIEIIVSDRGKVNKEVLEKIAAESVQIEPRYREYVKENNLQERVTHGVKKGLQYGGALGFINITLGAYGIYKGVEAFADKERELVREDTGCGCVVITMVLDESMKEDINKNILARQSGRKE